MAKIFKIGARVRYKGEPNFGSADSVYVEAVNAHWALKRAEKHYLNDPLVEENGKSYPCVAVQFEHLELIIPDFIHL